MQVYANETLCQVLIFRGMCVDAIPSWLSCECSYSCKNLRSNISVGTCPHTNACWTTSLAVEPHEVLLVGTWVGIWGLGACVCHLYIFSLVQMCFEPGVDQDQPMWGV